VRKCHVFRCGIRPTVAICDRISQLNSRSKLFVYRSGHVMISDIFVQILCRDLCLQIHDAQQNAQRQRNALLSPYSESTPNGCCEMDERGHVIKIC